MACCPSGPFAGNRATWGGWSPSLARPHSRLGNRPRLPADTASRDTFPSRNRRSLASLAQYRNHAISAINVFFGEQKYQAVTTQGHKASIAIIKMTFIILTLLFLLDKGCH